MEDNLKAMYLSMNSNSIVFSNYSWFPYRFFKDVENLRSDISIILMTDIENPAHFNPVKPERFSNIKFPSFESNRENFFEFTRSLIELNFDWRQVYADFDKSLNRIEGIQILPHEKFLSRIYLKKNKNTDTVVNKYIISLRESLEEDIKSNAFIFDQIYGARNSYRIYLGNISDYLILEKKYSDAEQILNIAVRLNTKFADKSITEMLGVCYIKQHRFKEAEILYQSLSKNYPDDFWYLYSLGFINMNRGKIDKAKMYLEKSIALNSNFAEARSALKRVNQQLLTFK